MQIELWRERALFLRAAAAEGVQDSMSLTPISSLWSSMVPSPISYSPGIVEEPPGGNTKVETSAPDIPCADAGDAGDAGAISHSSREDLVVVSLRTLPVPLDLLIGATSFCANPFIFSFANPSGRLRVRRLVSFEVVVAGASPS